MSAADKKARNESNNRRTTTNKKHTCKYCKNDYFKKCIGNHLFNAHADEMRTALAAYKTRITKPSLPLKAGADMYVCLCCHEIWNTAGRATAHLAKCDAEAQIKALYAFLDCDAPTAEITVRVPVAGAVKEAADENAVLLKTNLAQKIQIEKLSSLKNDYSEWASEKKRLNQKIAYLEYALFAKVEILVAQRDAAVSRIKENEQYSIIKEINSIQYDDDTRAELQKLAEDIKLYAATKSDDCLTIKRAAPEPEPEPEPVLELEPEPEPEPEPAPAAQPAPPPHNANECPVCRADFLDGDDKSKCVACNKTCHTYDEWTDCMLMECIGCGGKTCKKCWRACGSKKIKPYCSEKCKAPHDAIYLESRKGVKYVPA
jgi:hypothetical protein